MIYNNDHNAMPPTEDTVFYANHKIILPIVMSLLILIGLIAAVLLIKKKSEIIF